jgi:hypothetical protein
MATGYRLAKVTTYAPGWTAADSVSTPPGSISDAGGFWVTTSLKFAALCAVFRVPDTHVVQEVSYDVGDVLESSDYNGGVRISAGTASDLLTTQDEFNDYALGRLP